MAEEIVQCYNKGCGQKYNPKENKEDSCQYHPGGPIFHDALKGWSCCKKRSTDFSEFLSIPGCTRGPHSNIKPPEPEKPTPAALVCNGDAVAEVPSDAPSVKAPLRAPVIEPLERPSADETMTRIELIVGDSLRQALEKQLSEMSLTTANEKPLDGTGIDGEIQKGTSCKNNSCTAVYEGESSNTENCWYHPGVPVFHEGMKYWSCCERKTTDFNTFLSQAGCASGKHLWVKKDDSTAGEKRVACRFDWHQTAQFVTVSIFAKLSQPHKTIVEANKVALKVSVVFDGGRSQFDKHFILHGIVDPARSSVKMLGTKVEINLRKMEPGSWAKLELQPANQG